MSDSVFLVRSRERVKLALFKIFWFFFLLYGKTTMLFARALHLTFDPKSDLHLISSYNTTAESNKVTRIKE